MHAFVIPLLLIAAAATVAVPVPARACSQVETYVDGPTPGAELPGNLLFFRVTTTDPSVQLALVDRESGEEIPSHAVNLGGQRVFKPIATVAPGTQLSLIGSREGVTLFQRDFSAIEHSEISLGPATLRVVDQGDDAVLVHYEPGEATPGIAHLLSIHFSVDNKPFYREYINDDPNTFLIRADCDEYTTTDSCGRSLDGVSEGSHLLEAQAHILGLDEEPEAVRVHFNVACPQGCSAGPRSPEAGAWLAFALCLLGLLTRRRLSPQRRR